MYSFYKSTITHAHQQVIFSYEVLLYTKEEEEKWGTDWDLFLKKIGNRRFIRSYILLFNCFPIKSLGWYKSEQLLLVTEPEAAFTYCHCIPTRRLQGSRPGHMIKEPGTISMVVDIGGILI